LIRLSFLVEDKSRPARKHPVSAKPVGTIKQDQGRGIEWGDAALMGIKQMPHYIQPHRGNWLTEYMRGVSGDAKDRVYIYEFYAMLTSEFRLCCRRILYLNPRLWTRIEHISRYCRFVEPASILRGISMQAPPSRNL